MQKPAEILKSYLDALPEDKRQARIEQLKGVDSSTRKAFVSKIYELQQSKVVDDNPLTEENYQKFYGDAAGVRGEPKLVQGIEKFEAGQEINTSVPAPPTLEGAVDTLQSKTVAAQFAAGRSGTKAAMDTVASTAGSLVTGIKEGLFGEKSFGEAFKESQKFNADKKNFDKALMEAANPTGVLLGDVVTMATDPIAYVPGTAVFSWGNKGKKAIQTAGAMKRTAKFGAKATVAGAADTAVYYGISEVANALEGISGGENVADATKDALSKVGKEVGNAVIGGAMFTTGGLALVGSAKFTNGTIKLVKDRLPDKWFSDSSSFLIDSANQLMDMQVSGNKNIRESLTPVYQKGVEWAKNTKKYISEEILLNEKVVKNEMMEFNKTITNTIDHHTAKMAQGMIDNNPTQMVNATKELLDTTANLKQKTYAAFGQSLDDLDKVSGGPKVIEDLSVDVLSFVDNFFPSIKVQSGTVKAFDKADPVAQKFASWIQEEVINKSTKGFTLKDITNITRKFGEIGFDNPDPVMSKAAKDIWGKMRSRLKDTNIWGEAGTRADELLMNYMPTMRSLGRISNASTDAVIQSRRAVNISKSAKLNNEQRLIALDKTTSKTASKADAAYNEMITLSLDSNFGRILGPEDMKRLQSSIASVKQAKEWSDLATRGTLKKRLKKVLLEDADDKVVKKLLNEYKQKDELIKAMDNMPLVEQLKASLKNPSNKELHERAMAFIDKQDSAALRSSFKALHDRSAKANRLAKISDEVSPDDLFKLVEEFQMDISPEDVELFSVIYNTGVADDVLKNGKILSAFSKDQSSLVSSLLGSVIGSPQALATMGIGVFVGRIDWVIGLAVFNLIRKPSGLLRLTNAVGVKMSDERAYKLFNAVNKLRNARGIADTMDAKDE